MQTHFTELLWTCPRCKAQGGFTGANYPPTTLFGDCRPLEGTTQSLRGNTLGEMAHCSKCGWTGPKEVAEQEDHTRSLLQTSAVFQCAFP